MQIFEAGSLVNKHSWNVTATKSILVFYFLGTPHLREVLQEKLSEHIKKNLPMLQTNLQKRMDSLKLEIFNHDQLHPKEPELQKALIFK